jgi:ABC-type polysaccharide/polyol phosphate export permease
MLGKALGALVMSALPAVVVLAVVVPLTGSWPQHWGELLGFSLLLMVLFVALGTLAGTLLRRWQAVIPLSFGLALPLFFLSGAFGPANWGNAGIASVARVEPVTYGIGVFQHAFHGFQTTQSGLGTATVVMGAYAVVGVAVSAGLLRWRGVAH